MTNIHLNGEGLFYYSIVKMAQCFAFKFYLFETRHSRKFPVTNVFVCNFQTCDDFINIKGIFLLKGEINLFYLNGKAFFFLQCKCDIVSITFKFYYFEIKYPGKFLIAMVYICNFKLE